MQGPAEVHVRAQPAVVQVWLVNQIRRCEKLQKGFGLEPQTSPAEPSFFNYVTYQLNCMYHLAKTEEGRCVCPGCGTTAETTGRRRGFTPPPPGDTPPGLSGRTPFFVEDSPYGPLTANRQPPTAANRQPSFNDASVVLCLAHVLPTKQRASL